jgi:molybdate transport system substrate-binding protein
VQLRVRFRAPLAVLALAATVLATTGSVATASGPSAGRAAKLSGSITVFAASSLTEVFTKIGSDFQRLHPGVTVTFNFNASSTLAAQIQQAAPADVFASADPSNMTKVAGQISGRAVFAENLLQIAVAPGNPKHIRSLADTLKPGVQLVLCAPAVPCGEFALQAYAKQHLQVGNVPTGLNVKDTLQKVTLGEADAAVVYVTDVLSAKGSVTGVRIPLSQNVVAVYPIGVVKDSSNTPVARAFETYVLSAAGQRTMRQFGFLRP